MVQIKAFSYNPNAKYQPSGVYKTKDPDIIKQTIEVKQPSDASGSSFKVKFPDVFDKNMLPYVESDALVRSWNNTPMRFWQNQLNFAVWCATTGCGVSYEDHLSGDIPGFAKSMFMFHVYYQIRRIIGGGWVVRWCWCTQKQADEIYKKKNRTIPQNQRHLWSNNHS